MYSFHIVEYAFFCPKKTEKIKPRGLCEVGRCTQSFGECPSFLYVFILLRGNNRNLEKADFVPLLLPGTTSQWGDEKGRVTLSWVTQRGA